MQITQLSIKEHGFCVRDADRRQRLADYQEPDQMSKQVKEFTFLRCNLKQAVTVQSLAACIRQFFYEEGVDPDIDLNSYLKESVANLLVRQARQGLQPSQGTKPVQPLQAPPRKRDRENVVSFDLVKPIVCYQPNVETTRDSHEFDRNKSSPMDRALEIQAKLASNFPSFVKNMLPSHVAGGFWLGLPKNFTAMHLPKHDETVVLVDETELEHETKYLAEKNGLSAGWRGFSIAHRLQEKDVLVFHLVQQWKFKVYIVRAEAFSEIDGAIGLLHLGACASKMDNDHHEEGLKITVKAREEHTEQYSPVHSVQEKDMVGPSNNVDAAPDNSGMDIDNTGSDDFVGIRFAQSVVDFKDVKGFENFSIIVDRLIIDCEIPHHLRVKYYELCCSQKSYLHDQLIDGLNLRLVVGIIFETISIADAIRSFKPSTCENLKLKAWDNTLKAFEIFGMKVGFLRAKLMTLSSSPEDALRRRRLEKLKAKEELNALLVKLISESKGVV